MKNKNNIPVNDNTFGMTVQFAKKLTPERHYQEVLMDCISCEWIRQHRMHLCREFYFNSCQNHLNMVRPPRESFNRWLMDIFSYSPSQADILKPYPPCENFLPQIWTTSDYSDFAFLQRRFCDRIASRHLGADLFWELLDDLPFPIDLPPVVFPQTSSPKRNFKKRYMLSPTKAQTLSGCVCEKSYFSKETTGFEKRKHSRSKQIYENDHEICENMAILTASAILYAFGLSEEPDPQNIVNYLIRQLYNKEIQSEISHSLLWASHLLASMEGKHQESHLGVDQKTWFKELQSNFYLKEALQKRDVSLISHSTSPIASSSSQRLSFRVSVLYGLRRLKRWILIKKFGLSIITVCCELEIYLLQLFFQLPRHLYDVSWGFNATSQEDELMSCTRQASLCGLHCMTYALDGRLVQHKFISPRCLIQLLGDSSTNIRVTRVHFFWLPFAEDNSLLVSVDMACLRNLFFRFCSTEAISVEMFNGDMCDKFFSSMTRMLIRYSSILEQGKSGKGFQASLPSKVWNVLSKYLNVELECFASPLNATLENYCSMFPDVDSCFGSKGSFFCLEKPLLSGSYQLNPPFVEVVLERTVNLLKTWLKLSEEDKTSESNSCYKSGGPLCFVLVLPAWDNGPGCDFLQDLYVNAKEFIVAKLQFQPLEHSYGSSSHKFSVEIIPNQQWTFSRFFSGLHTNHFNSLGSSFLFILQNTSGRTKWPITDEILEELFREMS